MRLAFAVLVFLLWIPGAVGTADSDAYVKQLESTYRRARTLEAKFLQQYSEGGKITRSESGTAYFRRPGKMRWEYASPETNLFVVDGKFAWFYVPPDHTVSRVAARDSSDWRTPLALLAGEMKVSRVCAKVALSPDQLADGTLVRMNCLLRGTEKDAKSGLPHDKAEFEVSKSTGELHRIAITGSGGVRMEMRFSEWRFDPPAPEELFHFQPPKGVAIVNGDDLLAGPGSPLP